MSKQIPTTFDEVNYDSVSSGQRDEIRKTKSLGLNANFLLGNKVFEGGYSTVSWLANPYPGYNQQIAQLTGSVKNSTQVSYIKLPKSLNGRTTLTLVSAFDGTDVHINLSGSSGFSKDVSLSRTPQTIDLSNPGSWLKVGLVSAGTGSATPSHLNSLNVSYPRRWTYDSVSSSFQAIKQTAIADDLPDSAYVYRTLLKNEAEVYSEASNNFFTHYYNAPRTNATATRCLGEYWFYVEAGVSTATFKTYMHVTNGTATASLNVNGAYVKNASIKPTDGWTTTLQVTTPVTASAWNKLTVWGNILSSEGIGPGLDIAGVYGWEDACSSSLGVPASDSIPSSFVGMETSLMNGVYPILADNDYVYTDTSDGLPIHTGKNQLNKDICYLKSVKRRVLVCDWRHTTTTRGSGGSWHNAVTYDTTTFNKEPGLARSASSYGSVYEMTGSALANLLIPRRGDHTDVEVWLHLEQANAPEFYVTGGSAGAYAARTRFEIKVDSAGSETREVPLDLSFPNQDFDSGPATTWFGPFIVSQDTGSDPHIMIQGRCTYAGGVAGTSGYLTLHGVYWRQVPRLGAINDAD